MTPAEIFVHIVIAGGVMGIASYLVGNECYSGRRLSKLLLATIGFVSFLMGGTALFLGMVQWEVAVGLGVLFGIIGAFWFSLIPAAFDRLPPKYRRKT